MTMFFVSLGVFILSLILVFIFLGLWTYHDAKVKSVHAPGLWVLVTLLVPNGLGVVIYLLVGRVKKDVPAPGNFKKAMIASVIFFVISIGFLITGSIQLAISESFGGTMNTGTTFMSSEFSRAGSWTFSARRANATRSRFINISQSELDNFHVSASLESGEMILRLEQGSIVEYIDLFEFDGFIDLRGMGFRNGRIRAIVSLDNAERPRFEITWR